VRCSLVDALAWVDHDIALIAYYRERIVNRVIIVTVVNMAALAAFGVAHAGSPAWCKGASVESDDLRGLSSRSPRR
jgi:hypothetical protein